MTEQHTHTPGPWDYWDMDEFGFHVFADCFGTRAKGQDCRLSIAAVRSGRSHDEASENFYEGRANARLIAAAPDMLEALRDLITAVEAEVNEKGGGGFILARLTDARDAVRKATEGAS